MRTLIVGLGSIGRRHFRNLLALGERDLVLLRSHRSTLPDDELAGFPVERHLEAALERRPQAAIIATPTALHLESAIPAAAAGCHLLIEKPVSAALDGLDALAAALQASDRRCLIGYHLRFHPLLVRLRQWLDEGRLGTVRLAQASWGEYLPDWHPWEDHKRGYAARADLGGGAARTLSHPFDYLLWLLGDVREIGGRAANLGGLGVDADDVADVVLTFSGGARASVHLDYYRRPGAHWLELTGDRGTARLDFTAGSLEAVMAEDDQTRQESLPAGYERNDLFLEEMRHFRRVCSGEEAPRCSLADGRRSLEIALAVSRGGQADR